MSKWWWRPKGKVPQYATEEWVKKQVKDQLAQFGKDVCYFMPSANGYGKSGIEDFNTCAKAHTIAIETKKLDGVWSEAQQDRAKEIAKAGGVYIVVDETGLRHLWAFLANWMYNNVLPPGVHDFRKMQVVVEETKVKEKGNG
jgi:hypothetical protein